MSDNTNCTNDCSSCGENCSSRRAEQNSFEAFLNPYSSVKKVIGIMSGKGGVGKSSVTAMLAASTQKQGLKTAILDADITGPSIPKAFGITQKAAGSNFGILPEQSTSGIDIMSINLLLEDDREPVVWRGPVIAGTVKQFWTEVFWENEDIMFVDMPPGTGDVPLTVFQSLPVDGIIIVTSPQELVSMIVSKAVKMAELMNIPIIGLIENMSYVKCPDCGKKINIVGESHIDEIANTHDLKVLDKIPIDPEIAKACDEGTIESLNINPVKNAVEEIKKI